MSTSTLTTTDEWMRRQAGNVSVWAEDQGIDVRFLIHDHDTKFTEGFDEYSRRPRGGPILTPWAAPIANSFAESWIGALKRECLNHFACFSLGQLDYIVQAYAGYHNEFRPHQSLGNRPLGIAEDPPGQVEIKGESIKCREWLGGLLRHYHRLAA